MLTPNELRQKYLDFFVKQGHKIIPSASLLPENDPTTLFTSCGMQPLVPYLLGKEHPLGMRLTDSQKSFRSNDIEEVGDNRHTTFFEMLGNWSLGDYFKSKQLPWVFEFLTSEIKLDPKNLYVTVFRGNKNINIPRDDEAINIWKNLFKSVGIEAEVVDGAEKKGLGNGRIFSYEDNWWSRSGIPDKMPIGEPGGPDSEVFYDFGADLMIHEKSRFKAQKCHVNCDCGRFLEIGNSVFMEYVRTEKGFEKLPKANVDFGGGFERILAAINNDPDVFKTELFQPIIRKLEDLSGQKYEGFENNKRPFRIISDHIKAATMLAADGVFPSNKDQGYFSRRLLRRSVVYAKKLGIDKNFLSDLIPVVTKIYAEVYPEVKKQEGTIQKYFSEEEERFRKTLNHGLKEFEKLITDNLKKISGKQVFDLYQSYGFPIELTVELAEEKGLDVDFVEFEKEKQKHQEISREGAKQKFSGGLADQSEQTTKLHTATHLLHQALRNILGEHVKQSGSNITPERLRFDFSHPEKMTPEQITKVEAEVNSVIQKDIPITMEITTVPEAKKAGALALFEDKYQDKVKLYKVGYYSVEVCGGPHVEHTGILGKFRIKKEEGIGRGLRRIKAVLES
ncbi:hypothetical protein A2X44_02725 [candidate division CPR3 bacterium GWF2_35_18]|uniref:Alanine--tRNA ligase n=1 Tax=candidate division CPR3 bacterium GW2011_GWF2_35_18 TaxID=1618350 RepID=A0A0G0BIH0_UNCC3|nr:MAG: alanyl-tRNA synthetase [candidate division CPR3 bacterium GW2011_GWF2_35_18]KKP86880.1 MAG: alanyl-tRNA synthetase [candidate division CPR3 bacterium GW2011_GWE2_35_7]OGB62505.1 MAG: hypothetical protein A2X44_02725 [candidate division CPR3 bacterium GWF2_35_18]OGB65549.1 MAG: hypothetical protein A2250_04305 [candidate division CPR3 bacterium RIFOXYA2_FULL_35_13]OGB78940.1 MAG: hypothetical protein A2296_01315 [candidate division CPR3 bacterium RIFOXYB2_FULL_35_8]OGB80544.1 MAG: hypot